MLKRTFDMTVSAVGLVLSWPVWAVVAMAIKLEDGGPVFYRQRRVGRGGREFVARKFRSMTANSDQAWGAVPASEGDPRITRVGRVLRITAMDELPQLWNILRGDMSFVGPRPEWAELVKTFRREIPGFDRRHVVRPGLTGLAQIYGHSELPRRQKLRYDLVYIKRRGLWLDMRLVFVSFMVTLLGQWENRGAKLPGWLRYGRRGGRTRRLQTLKAPGSPVKGTQTSPERLA